MHFWQSYKKFCTFRATSNFRKFKVALNPMYRIFLNLPKAASYPAYHNSITRKKFYPAVFEVYALKVQN